MIAVLAEGARALSAKARRLRTDRGGAVAVIVGLSATILIALAGGGADYARLVSRRSQLQSAVDAGALAGGNALKLAMSDPDSIVGLVNQTIRSAANVTPERQIAIQASVSKDKTSVLAAVQEDVRLTFGRLLGIPTATVAVKARANVVGQMRLCMLMLDPLAAGTLYLERNAKVTAVDCSIYSNAASPAGMVGNDSAMARADTICTAGGYVGPRANFTPTPQTDCPVIKDPMADRAAPPVGPCATLPTGANGMPIANSPSRSGLVNVIMNSVTLEPGTYCGGLFIGWNAVVTLKPGVYVIKDGPLFVTGKATLTGTGAGFYFAGNRAGLLFDVFTTISLTAPASGPMAGLLMMEERTVTDPVDPVVAATKAVGSKTDGIDRIPASPRVRASSKPLRTYRIISDNAHTLLGTIYLPAGRLVIDAKTPVAYNSAYTVVVAQQVNLYEGPNLVLNSRYDGSSVPVPKGVGPVTGKLLLTQ